MKKRSARRPSKPKVRKRLFVPVTLVVSALVAVLVIQMVRYNHAVAAHREAERRSMEASRAIDAAIEEIERSVDASPLRVRARAAGVASLTAP